MGVNRLNSVQKATNLKKNQKKFFCFTSKFQEEAINHSKKSFHKVMIYDKHSSFGAVKKYW